MEYNILEQLENFLLGIQDKGKKRGAVSGSPVTRLVSLSY